jgi:hypothetical protein
MAAVIPLKIVSGTLSQFGTTDEIYAQGIVPRSGTALAIGDAATTQVDVGAAGATLIRLGNGAAGVPVTGLTIDIGTSGGVGSTINLGSVNTTVNINGSMVVDVNATFEGNTIIGTVGSPLSDTLTVYSAIAGDLTFKGGADHSILVAPSAGAGNNLSIVGAVGAAGNNAGGAAQITGGAGTGAAAGGQVTLTGGVSATGLAGNVSIVTSRTVDATPGTAGPALTLTESGTGGGTSSVWTGAADPNSAPVTGTLGSLYLRTGTGELYINTAATTWAKVATGTGGGATLQTAYTAGNTIATTTNPVALSVASGTQSVLTVTSANDTASAAVLVNGTSVGYGTAGLKVLQQSGGRPSSSDGVKIEINGYAPTTGTGDSLTFVAGPNTVTLVDAGASFVAADVGRNITIANSPTPANDGTFVVTAYISPTSIGWVNASGATEAAPALTWSMSNVASGHGLNITASGNVTGGAAFISNAGSGAGLNVTGIGTGVSLFVVSSGAGDIARFEKPGNPVLVLNTDGAITGTAYNNGVAGSAISFTAGDGVAAGGVGGDVDITGGSTAYTVAAGHIFLQGGHNTHATGAGVSGAISIKSGDKTGDTATNAAGVTVAGGYNGGEGAGGFVTITAGHNEGPTAGAGLPGDVNISGGAKIFGTANAGNTFIAGGAVSSGGTGTGGNVQLSGGAALSGVGGDVVFVGGTSASSTPGGIEMRTGRTTNNTAATDGPALKIYQAWPALPISASVYVGDNNPNGMSVSGSEGSLYMHYGAGAGELWLKVAAATTGWEKVGAAATQASQIVQGGFNTTTNAVTSGLLGYLTPVASVVDLASAAGIATAGVFGANEGTVNSMTTAGTIDAQKVEPAVTVVAGERLYLSAVSKGCVTNVVPSVAPQVILTVGYARTDGTGATATTYPVSGDTFAFAGPSTVTLAVAGGFAAGDLGRTIRVSGALSPANNGDFVILSVVNPGLAGALVTYSNGAGVSESAASAVTVMGGGDGFSAGPVQTVSVAGAFVASDVGRYLHIFGASSANNDGDFLITSVVAGVSATYTNPNTGTLENAIGSTTYSVSAAYGIGAVTDLLMSIGAPMIVQ